MSNFSQIMNDRSEARRIYNQRRKIRQLESKNEKLEQEIKQLKEIWKDTNIIIKDDKKLIMNGNAYDCLQDYKSRCEKAIEYLKKREYDNSSCSVCSFMSDDLLNILNGSDEK